MRKLNSLEDWIFYFVKIFCMIKVHCEISLFVHLLQFNGLGNIRYSFDRLVNCSYEHNMAYACVKRNNFILYCREDIPVIRIIRRQFQINFLPSKNSKRIRHERKLRKRLTRRYWIMISNGRDCTHNASLLSSQILLCYDLTR